MVEVGWVLEQIEALGAIGASAEGGRTRLCYSEADEAGRAYVRGLMQDLGLSVREDVVGNLFGRLAGRDSNQPALLIGSHVDTVPQAGAFDGCLGVLAGLGVIRGLIAEGRLPRRPIEVVSFMGEESSRFGLAMIGSRAFAGLLDPASLDGYRDADGRSLRKVLSDRGANPESIRAAAVPPGTYHAYVELHIDQGTDLDAADRSVGIVTGIAAPERWRFTLQGEAAHSGAASMSQRRDPLMATAALLSQIEEFARAETDYQTVATVGQMELKPNAINIVPGEVTFSLDVRSVSVESRDRLVSRIRQTIQQEALQRQVILVETPLKADKPVAMDARLQAQLTKAAVEQGVSYMPMPSMAGHDAMNVASVCPAAMLLCRNRSRISHNPREWAAPEDVADALQVFARAVRQLAEE